MTEPVIDQEILETWQNRLALEEELFASQFQRLDRAVDHLIGSVVLLSTSNEVMGPAMSYEATLAHIVAKAAAALNEIQRCKDAADNSYEELFDSTPSILMTTLMNPYFRGSSGKRTAPRKPGERATTLL